MHDFDRSRDGNLLLVFELVFVDLVFLRLSRLDLLEHCREYGLLSRGRIFVLNEFLDLDDVLGLD